MDTESTQTAAPVPESQDKHLTKPRFPFAMMFLVLVLVVFVTMLVTLALPESFKSNARLRIERDPSDISGLVDSGAGRDYDPHFIHTEMQILQSEIVLSRAIGVLDLNRQWGRKYGGGNPLKTTETLAMLRARLSVLPVGDTSVVEIDAYAERPEEAAKLANGVAEAYRDYRLQLRQERTVSSLQQLERAYEENQAKITTVRAQIADLTREPGDADASRSPDANQRLESLMGVDQMLGVKIAAAKAGLGTFTIGPTEIVDKATPSARPFRPRLEVNIFAGILVGSVAGVALATLVHFLALRRYWRQTRPPRTPLSAQVRTLVHFFVALTMGAIMGYFCATPLDPATLIVIPTVLVLAVCVCAWIEMANFLSDGPYGGERKAFSGSPV